MVNVSDLSSEQVEEVKGWVAGGAQMADVQRRLNEDFGFKATYMDTRFISLDLELDFQVNEVEAKIEEVIEAPQVEEEPDLEGEKWGGGGVSASLDQVARPGSMVSGTVTFSDGMKGLWLIDEMGRPSIDPDQPGYQPSEADLVSFQEELKGLLDGQV
jgi:hypothetical protein